MAARAKPCAKHRAAQAKHVRKIGAATQRTRVKKHYEKNRAKVLADKKAARKPGGAAGKHGSKIGRPREC